MDKIDWEKLKQNTKLYRAELVEALEKVSDNDKILVELTSFTYPPTVLVTAFFAGTNDLDKLLKKVSAAMTPVCEKWKLMVRSYKSSVPTPGWNYAQVYYVHLKYSSYVLGEPDEN